MSTSKSLQSVHMCVSITISNMEHFHLFKSAAPHPNHSCDACEGPALQISEKHYSHWLLGVAPGSSGSLWLLQEIHSPYFTWVAFGSYVTHL